MTNFTDNGSMATVLVSTLLFTLPVLADGNEAINQAGAIKSPIDKSKTASFDILAAHAHREGRSVTFHMTTNGKAGSDKPKAIGQLGGSSVYGYVWPTTLDPSVVGFDGKSGILALAATSHPDFDDTPLYDENNDGNLTNDGSLWHSHWVVLAPTKSCGEGALAVKDIPKGTTPKLPVTWPGLPILIDSPGYTPQFSGAEIKVTAPFSDAETAASVKYDGVTAGMRVNENIHAPLLCVTNVFDIASGNLSLPGVIK